MSTPPPALARLVGEWTGEGRGEYPTIQPFPYRERVTFTLTGKPVLRYEQRTTSLATGTPLHSEVGYVRNPVEGLIELVLTHPTGVVEVQEGTLESEQSATRIRVAATAIAVTSSAKQVDALERDIDVVGDRLDYAVRMAAVGVALTHHLAATLHRID